MRTLRIILRLTALNLRARMDYRTEFLLSVTVGAMWQIAVLVFATVLLVRFPGMGGWSSGAVLLIAGTRLLSHGLYVLIFGRVAGLTSLVQSGQIDVFLLRPIPVYRQVQLAFFNVNAIGDLLVASALFAWAVERVDVDWSLLSSSYLIGAVIGGMFMEAAIVTTISCAALHAPATAYWSQWVEEIIGTFGNYPLHILPHLVRDALTFGLPVAFIAYFPIAVVSGNRDSVGAPALLVISAPLIGLLAYAASRRLWLASLHHYKGFGN
ncbi:ABC-2 family transporter protein [Streptomyces sp. B21-105]